jgi:serine/threonine protein kinase
MVMESAPKSPRRHVEGFPQVGDVVAGKYEVERILGVGGMGIVVAARHKHLQELVAVKLLHPDAAMDGEAVARLLREARATISIKSEHVVRVHDVGTLDSGSPYILMEYLTGVDLAELVRTTGYLPIPDAVDYLLQAGEAIAEAHARGIVHRDLKPSNLFLTKRPDGTALVKVLDFGISKALALEESGNGTEGTSALVSLTATKAVFGSPMYMSPEQVRSAKRVDERTDIWALGVILHELLTGASPFSGETMPGVLASISADAPEPLRRRRPDAPAELEAAIQAALVKNVTERTQSVVDLARMVEPFASPEGKRSLERIVRLSMPGGVSKRALPPRSSAPPPPSPSHPPAALALGSTVRATTAGASPRRRARRGLVLVSVGAVLAIGYATWTLRGRYDRESLATPLPPASAAAAASSATGAQDQAEPPPPAVSPPAIESSTASAPRAPLPKARPTRHPRPAPSASSSVAPSSEPAPADPLNGR